MKEEKVEEGYQVWKEEEVYQVEEVEEEKVEDVHQMKKEYIR